MGQVSLQTAVAAIEGLGSFVFALSGGLLAVQRRFDLFGVLLLSFVAAVTGGITRDVLIGATPPPGIADWRYIAVPVLAGLLLKADDGKLSLSGFDYEVSARVSVEAEVDEEGTVLVSGRLLADIASRLPNAPVQFTTEDGKIAVRCGSARFTLSSMPV